MSHDTQCIGENLTVGRNREIPDGQKLSTRLSTTDQSEEPGFIEQTQLVIDWDVVFFGDFRDLVRGLELTYLEVEIGDGRFWAFFRVELQADLVCRRFDELGRSEL